VLDRGANRVSWSGALANAQRTVTVYVSTDRVLSEPALRDYEKRSGIRVNMAYDTEPVRGEMTAPFGDRR
jgi:hypothetical protein